MDWRGKSVLKEALMQGLVATGTTAITLFIVAKPALDSTLLISVLGAVTLANILYSILLIYD